jgi:16S rRNA (uracil1498-N3)-methyltransferase
MRSNRVYANIPLQADNEVALPAGPARHLLQVLRLRIGDDLVVFNGDGHDYPATLSAAQKEAVRVQLGQPGPAEPALQLRLHLGLGISKGERMDFAIQKAVELGVAAITPLFTERCVVKLDSQRLAKRLEHWQGVLVAACEQSGRRRLPSLHPASSLADWLVAAAPGVILDHRAAHSLNTLPRPGEALSLLVGPEGGLSPSEHQQAHAAGLTGVRLGPRVLRTETAPLAAIAAMQVLWGDMG